MIKRNLDWYSHFCEMTTGKPLPENVKILVKRQYHSKRIEEREQWLSKFENELLERLRDIRQERSELMIQKMIISNEYPHIAIAEFFQTKIEEVQRIEKELDDL